MNITVQGGHLLKGEITPSGSKNSVVALIPSSILFDKEVEFENVPNISDVRKLVDILQKIGSKIDWDKKSKIIRIDNSKVTLEGLGKIDLGNMRGTSLLWGPMLARFKKVNFSELPGGCTLGIRSVNPHFDTFSDLDVEVTEQNGGVNMDATNAKAREILLSEMSPTVTENVIMLATSLKGKTKVVGAASEPQVQDLCEFLNKCGAKISGIGSSVLEIEGGKDLTPVSHEILSDHYEIATFMALGVLTGEEIKIYKALPDLMKPILNTFQKFGVNIKYDGDTAMVSKQDIVFKPSGGRGTLSVKAQPWPALPVDTLPLFIPLALAAQKGSVLFHNWMYEAGLFWTSELQKLGANVIMADPHRVIVNAGNRLIGCELEAPYIIRAVVAMVMAAMVAEGETTILNADALHRGHPYFAENLRKLGAKIKEI